MQKVLSLKKFLRHDSRSTSKIIFDNFFKKLSKASLINFSFVEVFFQAVKFLEK